MSFVLKILSYLFQYYKSYPQVCSKKEFQVLLAKKPFLKCIECDGLPDVVAATKEMSTKYAKHFTSKAIRYDEEVAVTPKTNVFITCETGNAKAVAVALVWVLWKEMASSKEQAEYYYVRRRGRGVAALLFYKASIDVAVALLQNGLFGLGNGQVACSDPSRSVSEAACVGDQSISFCQWQGNGLCIYNSGTHLAFQQYPLEAATATLTTAMLAPFTFYPIYEGYTQAQRFATAFNLDFSDPKGLATQVAAMLARVETLMVEDQYFVLLNGIRLSTIAARDVAYGTLETIRAFEYVFNDGVLPAAFHRFQTTMFKIIAFMETCVEVFVDEGFLLLIDLGNIAVDLAQLVTDPQNALVYLEDILKQILNIVEQTLKVFMDFVMSIPGIDQLCSFINVVVGLINEVVGGIINDVIIPIIHFVMATIHAIENLVQKAVGFVENAYKTAIGAITGFFQNLIAGVEQVISDIANVFNEVATFVDYMVSDVDYIIHTIDYWFSSSSSSGGGTSSSSSRRHLLIPTVFNFFETSSSDYTHKTKLIPTGNHNRANNNTPGVGAPPLNTPPAYGEKQGNADDSLLHPIHIAPIQCPKTNKKAIIPQEATQCTYDSDCAQSGSYCVIESIEQCNSPLWLSGNITGNLNINDLWAKPCPCLETTSGNSYCNLASGFCQEGITPFGDPIATCPANGVNAFVDDNDYYDLLCYLLPVYKCSGKYFNDLLPRTDDEMMNTCVANLVASNTVSGPHLCRDYCSPSAFNIDNRLVTVDTFGCACAIGWSVGGNNPLPSLSANINADLQGRRRLLQNDIVYLNNLNVSADARVRHITIPRTFYGGFDNPWLTDHPSRWFSFSGVAHDGADFCMEDNDCERWDAICKDTTGNITSCSSCAMRNIVTGRGHKCRRGKCTCTKVPTSPLGLDFSHIVWEGSSNCAIIGRAYGQSHSLRAIEYTALRDCAYLHITGVLVGKFFSLPTLQPRFMYDRMELFRSTTNLAFGAFFSIIYYDKNDTELWERYTKLHIDPGLAVPATRASIAIAQKLNNNFPNLKQVGSRLASIWLKISVAATVMPSGSSIKDAFAYIGDTTQSAYNVVLPNNATKHHRHQIKIDIDQFQREAFELAVKLPQLRRKILSSTNLIPLSCPVATIFVNQLVIAGQTMQDSLVYNVPFEACRLLHPEGGDSWKSCPKPSWVVHPYTSPPPPPSSTPSPPSNSISKTFTTGSGAFGKFFFALVKKVTNFDILAYMHTKFTNILNSAPKVGDNAQQAISNIEKKLQCQFTTNVQCAVPSNTGHDMLYNAATIIFEYAAIYQVLNFFGLQFLASATIPFMVGGFLPRLFSKTYGMGAACSLTLTPVIPACFVADIQDALYKLLPRHLQWPSPLVNTRHRNPTAIPMPAGRPIYSYGISSSDVSKCTDLGFGDGVLEIFYFADLVTPGWRSVFTSATTDTFLGFNASKELNYWKGKQIHSHLYEQCAILYSFTAVPILILFALAVLFFIAALHVAVVFTAYVFKSLQHLYQASAESYIESRDEE